MTIDSEFQRASSRALLVRTPFLVLHDVIENRPADRDSLAGLDALAIAAGGGRQLVRFVINEHDAAAIGFDPFENQVDDAGQELVDIERVADGQSRAIHDLQVAAGGGEPGAVGGVGGKQAAARIRGSPI